MDRSLQPPTPRVQDLTSVVDVSKGGTGANNVFDAATQLGGVNLSKLGQAGGLAKSNGSGQVDQDVLPNAAVFGVTLNGPTQMSINQIATFVITNYDSLSNYVVSASSGTVSISGDTITYTAPASAGTIQLTVAGKIFNILVGAIRPAQPSISVSSTGDSGLAALVLTGSAFIMLSGTGTHKSSDWEVYSDAALTDLVGSSLDDINNKTGWTLTGLALSTTYYSRVRYKSNNNEVSTWSEAVAFTTKADYSPTLETAIISAPDKAANDFFGGKENEGPWGISMDDTGTRIAVGARGADYSSLTNNGAIYVFVRVGSNWNFEQKITVAEVTNNGFSSSIAMDGSGTRIVAGNFGNNTTASSGGAVFVFRRTNSTWAQEQKILPPGIAAGSYAGYSVDISADGLRLIIGSTQQNGYGGVWIYLRNVTTWAVETSFSSGGALGSGSVSNEQFGYCVALTADASRAIVVAFTGGSSQGCYVYRRTGTTWVQEQKITNPWGGSAVITSAHIDATGTRLVIGDRNNDRAGIFVRSGTTWSQEATLTKSGVGVGSYLGQVVRINSAGNLVAVSAPTADTRLPTSGFNDNGGVFLYKRDGTTWTYQGTAEASIPIANDNFGWAMGMSNNGMYLAGGSYKRTVGGVVQAGQVSIFSS